MTSIRSKVFDYKEKILTIIQRNATPQESCNAIVQLALDDDFVDCINKVPQLERIFNLAAFIQDKDKRQNEIDRDWAEIKYLTNNL